MKELYVHGIVQDYNKSINSLNKYLFSENERLNSIIDELEEKRNYDLCFISHLKKDKKELQHENKHLNLQLDQALKDYEELLVRIDKAIEYIEDMPDDYEYHGLLYDNEEKRNLLEILGDKENE